MSDATAPDPDELPPYLRSDAAPAPTAKIVQLPGTEPAPERPTRGKRAHHVDLEALERDYRAGVLSTRELGTRYDCSHVYVVQQAKKLGWTRDIKAKARAKADALLLQPEPLPDTSPIIAGELDAQAGQMAYVRRRHRKLIDDSRGVIEGLLREIRGLATVGDVERLYLQALKEDDPKARATGLKTVIDRITGLPSRIYGIKKLSDAAKNIIALERQAYELDAPDEGKPPPPKDANTTPAEVYAWLSQLKP